MSIVVAVPLISWIIFLAADLCFPFHFKVDYSTIILDDGDQILNGYLSDDDKWRLYLEPEDITPDLKKAILFKEDQYFYSHPGVNPVSVFRAFFQNISSGRRKSGASTITMQLARLLNPKERTYKNKLIEMFNAFQLEYHYSKEDILRLYLNLLPYGGNIEGVKSASHIYFGKDPKLLSLAELTGIVTIPNRPGSLSIKGDNAPINEAKNEWLGRFQNALLFQSHIIDLAFAEELKPKRRSLPAHLPHLSRRLKSQSESDIIHTFISFENQKKIEEIALSHITRLKDLNVTNTSIIVIDNFTNRVVNYVGSANFYDMQSSGQVDGVDAIRSPGSTLKPLLYALFYDRGTLSPRRRIADVRMNFGGYEPENYDNSLHGWISSEEALKQSLNVPTVNMLNEYGISEFIEPLVKARFQTIDRTRDHLGLSMILGGCGVSLEELAGLYAAFANHGSFKPLKFHRDTDSTVVESSIISVQSAYILTEILTEVTRPDLPDSWKDNPNRPKIAWKTGTSFGRRDAWSLGYNKNYTVGVWAGNFSGEGAPELSGVGVAAPILFDVFNVISDVSTYDWYTRPPGIRRVRVCDETGLLPNVFCVNTVADQFIEGVTNPGVCQHLKPIRIAADSSESYCMTCVKDAKNHIEALFPNHSPEMLDYFESEKISFVKAPDHYRFCERVFPNQGLEIVSPVDKLEYYVDVNDENQIQLIAQSPSNATKYYWYIDDEFYKSSNRNESIYFTPKEGKLKISCSDDRGRNQDIVIYVKKVSF